MEPVFKKGQLITWKDNRGFGFIQSADGSQEVFLHISELKDSTRRPQVGDTIYYYGVAEDGKARACNAFILGARDKSTSRALSTKVSSTSQFLVLEVLLLSMLPLLGSVNLFWTAANPIPLILYPTMSVLTFFLYADDKSRAKKGSWRISEQTLHLCELLGGWLGGFVAQRKLHHKSSKKSYQTEFWAIATLHYIVWLGWLFFGKFLLG